MNLTQKQLRMFITTAAFANVTRASEALHITQPALTRALREFESQLGCELFRRTTRSFVLTREGEQFLPKAHRLLSEMERVVSELGERGEEAGGTIVVGVGSAFACTVLPAAIARMARLHPAAQVRLLTGNSGAIATWVHRGEVDLGFASPVGDVSGIEFEPLLSAPLGVLGEGRKFQLGRFVTPRSLAGLPLLKDAADTSTTHLLRTYGPDLLAQMQRRAVEISDLSVQIALAKAGIGLAVVSALGASHPEAAGLAFSRFRPAIERRLFAMWRAKEPASAVRDALLECVRDSCSEARLHRMVKILAVR